MSVIGRDVFQDVGNGQLKNCWTICELPNMDDKACRFYCKDYVHSTTASTRILTAFSTTSAEAENESIPPSVKLEFIILIIMASVILFGIISIMFCLANVKRKRKSTKNSTDEETGQKRPCNVYVHNETPQFVPGHPGQVAIDAGNPAWDPSATEPLLPGSNRETNDRLDVQDSLIPDTPSGDVNNDNVSTNSDRSGLAQYGSGLNDEAFVAAEQFQQDGLSADEYRRKENEVIRGEKVTQMRFGDTKPI
ncbi:uncharacterized protein LOC128205164 [Mya arenaria]|uniref:uncharacterized protein LOC128205164 n=1 Tax=Mya arenaria TaxID=6604 RepID=UPI0022E0CD24|nr:uncharacterized protein LOC128205164 [Mya arenaria]